MILNIFGRSGSGKTTLIKNLLRNKNMQNFYKSFVESYDPKKESEFKIALSLVPTPNYRGSIKELLEIYGVSLDSLQFLNPIVRNLLNSIFELGHIDDIYHIGKRSLETLSAGEIRRFFILKSLLINADLLIVDEPFSNSDPSLFNVIYEAISYHENSIILSHIPIEEIVNSRSNQNIAIEINHLKNNLFLNDL